MGLSRRKFMKMLGLAGAAMPLAGSGRVFGDDQKKRPNFIFVVTDDQGWGDIGYNTDTSLKTPHLDAMAREGIRMDRFYAAAPVCSPTRASCLTGRAPARTGVPDHTMELRLEERTIAEVLKEQSYATGHFGKWHLGGIPKEAEKYARVNPNEPHPGNQGFDYWFSHRNYFDLNPDSLYLNGEAVGDLKGEPCGLTMDRALPWMEECSQEGRPFMACIWFPHPHRPHRPLDESIPEGPEDIKHRRLMGEVVEVDNQVGRLRQWLRDKGIAENTMLWFHSDNGVLPEGNSDGDPFQGYKSDLWEGGIRVPGMVEWPGRLAARRIENFPVCTTDIFPTILDVLGLRPDGLVRPIDGQSVWKLIRDGEMEARDPIGFWITGRNAEVREESLGYHAALIDGNLKLHRNPFKPGMGQVRTKKRMEGVEWLLFDIEKDPGETLDVKDAHPGKFEEMKKHLLDWQQSVLKSAHGADYPEK
ncbi:MAG: sulfatase [Candidatus Sumerlaeota bacterium]